MSDAFKAQFTTYQVKRLERWQWEAKNVHKFTQAFEATNDDGCKRHGMRFVKASEAAIDAAFGGILPPFDHGDPVTKLMILRVVLAVLDSQMVPA